MGRIILALLAPLLLAACSSGGGTSNSSAGVSGFTAGTTGLLIVGTLAVDNFSIDTRSSDCTIPPDGVVDNIVTSDLGTMSITIRDTSEVPIARGKGVIFTSYTVSYTPSTQGAPPLTQRSHSQSLPILIDDESSGDDVTEEASVIIAELDTTKPEFNARNTGNRIFTYTVTVTFRGRRTDTDQAVSVAASASIEMGDFCPAAA